MLDLGVIEEEELLFEPRAPKREISLFILLCEPALAPARLSAADLDEAAAVAAARAGDSGGRAGGLALAVFVVVVSLLFDKASKTGVEPAEGAEDTVGTAGGPITVAGASTLVDADKGVCRVMAVGEEEERRSTLLAGTSGVVTAEVA